MLAAEPCTVYMGLIDARFAAATLSRCQGTLVVAKPYQATGHPVKQGPPVDAPCSAQDCGCCSTSEGKVGVAMMSSAHFWASVLRWDGLNNGRWHGAGDGVADSLVPFLQGTAERDGWR